MSLIDRLSRKRWTDEDIRKYVGRCRRACLTCATDEMVRNGAASGGTVSALLINALESELIDGAILCRLRIRQGRVRPEFILARTPAEVLEARGSHYVQTRFNREALRLVENSPGRLALVALPCNVEALQRHLSRRPHLSEKVVLTISLTCGHSSQQALVDAIADKLERKAGARIVNFSFRTGLWRGKLTAEFANGVTIRKPAGWFTLYQNLHYFSEKKCLFCHDHFGYGADLCVGDVWLYRLKSSPVKYNGVIVRTDAGDDLLKSAVQRGAIQSEPLAVTDILNGQVRSAPFHHNVTARHKAGRVLGIRIPGRAGQRVGFCAFLAAFLALLNWKWSQSPRLAWIIFKVPRILLKAYLVLFKALQSAR